MPNLSLSSRKWNIINPVPENAEDIIPLILSSRGLTTNQLRDEFTNPPSLLSYLKDMPDDFKISLKKSRDKILEYVKSDDPVVIYGDYDADGICATVILYSTIKNDLNHQKTYYFIPNRFEHGYGVSEKALDKIIETLNEKSPDRKKALLVTVDTGITAAAEVEYAKQNGFEVIITDHHQKPEKIPAAYSILWSDATVGSGISWFLSKALGCQNEKLLGLAALATVTDLQPIVGLNRSFVKYGLEVLNKNPVLGLKTLYKLAGKNNEISTYDLGWVIGPRLNASGRIEDADTALELLLTQDEQRALELSNTLNSINFQRQDMTQQMYELALDVDEKNIPKIIISHNESYHEGIIGLVASKLVQKYYRPSIVISVDGGVAKGSVRSVSGINIIEVLRNFEDLFENLGGHPMAAGFSIKNENINKLREVLATYADQNFNDELFIPSLDIDLQLPLEFAELELLTKIESLEPFGLGNSQPVFVSNQVVISDINLVGKDKTHVSFNFYHNGKTYRAIYFGGSEYVTSLKQGDKVDIAYKLLRNEYNGNTYVNLNIVDLTLRE